MRRHTIEVDDEVMAVLKERAEPFVDSPNDVLRRLLLRNGDRPRQSTTSPAMRRSGVLLELPPSTPKALEQTLQVTYLTRKSSRSRSDATRVVAEAQGIAPQTVIDKYCRQLGMTADDFDELLREESLQRLERVLKKRYDGQRRLIEDVLSEIR